MTSYAQHATHYRVGERTIKRWAAKGAPLSDEAGMVSWAKTQTNLPAGFVGWLDERKGKIERPESESDWAEFEKLVRTDDPKESMEKIAKARDFAAFMFEKASRENDKKNQKHYTDILAKMESCLHDALLRGKKLGLDSGELLPRSDVERLIWAVAFWLLRSTDAHLDSLTAKLRALSPGLDGEPVRSALEGELLSARFLEPFVHAAKVQSGVGLPAWVIAKMREACGDFLEGGEQQFNEHTKHPVTP